MIKFFITLLVALNLIFSPGTVLSQNQASANEQENDNNSKKLTDSNLRDLGIVEVNRLLQNHFPFLQLGYANHDEDEDENENGFVLSYDWHKDWDTLDFIGDGSLDQNYAAFIYRGSIFAEGSVGLGDATSPENLSELGFSLSFKQASFGRLKTTNPNKDKLDKCINELISLTLPEDEFNQRAKGCGEKFGIDDLIEVNHIDQFQWVYGFDAHTKLETNENYSEKHYVYGLELIGAVNPPKGHTLTYLNIPDLPFMLTRKIFGGGNRFQATLPIVRAAIQYVDTQDDEQRKAIAPEDDSFTRFFGEAAFTTLVCSIDGNPIKFNAAYRYYHELDADNKIKDAGLDVFDYFSASIQVPVAMFSEKVSDNHIVYLRFSDGELPFDEKSKTTVEIGWSTNINFEGLIGK